MPQRPESPLEESSITTDQKDKAVKVQNQVCVLLAFFEVGDMVHYESLPQGQAVYQLVYKKMLQHLLCS